MASRLPCTQQCSRASEAGDCSAAAVSSKFLVHKGIVACFLRGEAMLLSLGNTDRVPGIQPDLEQSAGKYKE